MVRKRSSGSAHADRELGEPVADLRLEIAAQPGEVAERDKSEDEKDGFDDRRHGSAE